MPQAELKYNSDLDINAKAILESIEATIQVILKSMQLTKHLCLFSSTIEQALKRE